MTLHTGRFIMLFCAAFMLIFVSCEDNHQSQVLPEGMGLVHCTLNAEIEVKSEEDPLEKYKDYNIQFMGVDGYADSEVMRVGDVEWPMPWYFGIYQLRAESCTRTEAEQGYGKLRYEGLSEAFSVINGQTATASVTCRVANFRVNVYFDDSMYEAFDAFQFDVQSVLAPPAVEEGEESEEETETFVSQLYRRLIFDPIEQTGYYNLQSEPMHLHYKLLVKHPGAEVFVESGVEGYFVDKEEIGPSIVEAGDIITFRVRYTGEVVLSDGVKFIIDGQRSTLGTSLQLPGYNVDNEITEDE